MITSSHWSACLPIFVVLWLVGNVAPAVGATFVVSNANDSGTGSLREAIGLANADATADTINFAISGTGVHTITLASSLPAITQPVTINGYSQSGSSPNTVAAASDNAVLQMELQGATDVYIVALTVHASDCLVKGLAINSCAVGLTIDGARNRVEGCFIGTNATATAAAGNAYGIDIVNGATNTTIGGTTAARNIIGGQSQTGIRVLSSASVTSDTTIVGNFIGLGKDGATAIANSTGIYVSDNAKNTTIGGTAAGARNVVSGNGGGINIFGAGVSGNTIQGNLIGTDATGLLARPNGLAIRLGGDAGPTTVGGTTAAARNVISGNDAGFYLGDGATATVQGNYIGTSINGDAVLANNSAGLHISNSAGNLIGGTTAGAGNVIGGNTYYGVWLSGAQATANQIVGNYLGTNASGADLGNQPGGVVASDGAANNTIGGVAAGAGNTVAFNAGAGILIYFDGGTQNSIRGNKVFQNGGVGIKVEVADSQVLVPTPNDALDADTGPNDGQNAPVLTALETVGGVSTLSGVLDSTPSATYSIDIFGNSEGDSSGFGEGRFYLGSVSGVATDANGHATFSFAVPTGAAGDGRSFAATATNANGSTGEIGPVGVAGLVTNTEDSGVGSLRFAIQSANFSPGTTIRFNIPESDRHFANGVFTITPHTALFPLTADGTVVDGASQKVFTPDANPAGPAIVLSGSAIPARTYFGGGLTIGASHCLIRQMVINGFQDGAGIEIAGGADVGTLVATANRVEGCYLGTDATGSEAVPNNIGIIVNNGYKTGGTTTNTFIGGATLEKRNVISGNSGYGVALGGLTVSGTTISGDYLGLNRTGTAALGAGTLIGLFNGTHDNLIGGVAAGARNVISGATGGSATGISINGQNGAPTQNNTVQGNFLGTDATGTIKVGLLSNGISISAPNNTIGGTAAGAGNVIGNASIGVGIDSAANNTVQGNFIGTNSSGANLGNNHGVYVAGSEAKNNLIGVAATGAGNVISGNSTDGILISQGAEQNTVQGNTIGLAPDKTTPLPNGEGLRIDNAAKNNLIGGSATGEGNFVSANTFAGVSFYGSGTTGNKVQGNTITSNGVGAHDYDKSEGVFIGYDASGNTIGAASDATGAAVGAAGNSIIGNTLNGVLVQGTNSKNNTIRGNKISGNGQLGINLQTDEAANTVTANDSKDPDGGANNTQNFPLISSISNSGGMATIAGTLNSLADTDFVVDLYQNSATEPSGFGEGAVYLGSTPVHTDANGNGAFSFNTITAASGRLFSVTATNILTGDTSEFSPQGTGNIVRNTLDSGPGSLRSALKIANSLPGTTILFNIPATDAGLSNGVFRIQPLTPLPVISADGTVIDGSSQTTFGGNTNSTGPEIAIDGANCAADVNGSHYGLFLNSAFCTVQGLAITHFGTGLETFGSKFHHGTIRGCYIGLDPKGVLAAGNGTGIALAYGPHDNTIGGPQSGDRNVISGNTSTGLAIYGTGTANNLVAGNFIGTNASGTSPQGNGRSGVSLGQSTTSNTIGGTTTAARNVIAGNAQSGVEIGDSGTTGNKIWGNYIGTDVTGEKAVGNEGNGVSTSGEVNPIGGVAAGAGNRIAFNRFAGVDVSGRNGSTIRGNQIYSNGTLGIDLSSSDTGYVGGVTENDDLDTDSGANGLQNFPAISGISAAGGLTTITGILSSRPNRDYVLDFYRVGRPDATNHGEGDFYLGNTSVRTDANGQTPFSVSGAFEGQYYSATATDVLTGDTSEFSAATISLSITGFSPKIGSVGTSVVITGTNFQGATKVQFNGVDAANFTVNDAGTKITAILPTGASTGLISVFSPLGTISSTANFVVTPPANDDFADAIAMPGDYGRLVGSNRGATRESGEPLHGTGGAASVWYRWTPSKSGRASLGTINTDFDTILAVYTGTSLANLQLVAQNDNIGASNTSGLNFAATAGTTYFVAVDGTNGAEGTFYLDWQVADGPPANDNFASAQTIEGSYGYVTGLSLLATKQTDEPNHAGNVGGASVWYSWTAPADARITFSTEANFFDTTLGVYTGPSVDALALVGSNDDAIGSASSVTFQATAGKTYRIAVDGFKSSGDSQAPQGAFALTWNTSRDQTSTISWTGGGGDGLWSNPANWNLNRIPDGADVVSIAKNGTYTVTLDIDAAIDGFILGKKAAGTGAGHPTLLVAGGHTLTFSNSTINLNGILHLATGGTLQANYSFEIHGLFDWTGGIFQGNAHTYINADGILDVHGPDEKRLDYGAITNLGRIKWRDTGNIVADNGASIVNQNIFKIDGDATFDWDGTGLKPGFLNDKSATLTKIPTTGATTGTSTFKILFGNDGKVVIGAGILSLQGGGISFGAFDIAEGARINVADDYVFDKEASSFTGNGFAALINGTTRIDIAVNVANFELSNGQLGGTSELQASNKLLWSGGSMTGAGATTMKTGSLMKITGIGAKALTRRTLNNRGVVNWDGQGKIAAGSGAVVDNQGDFYCLPGSEFSYSSGAKMVFKNRIGAKLVGDAKINGSLHNLGRLRPAKLSAFPAAGGRSLDDINDGGGLINIVGDLTQGAGSSIDIRIKGTTDPATGQPLYGQILVGANVILEGNSTLTAAFENYTPRAGDSFEIMRALTIQGDFTTFTKPVLPPGLEWVTSKVPGGVPLGIVTSYILKVRAKPPVISAFTPQSGAVGRTVTLSGTHLIGSDGAKPSVTFNQTSVPAEGVTIDSPTEISVVIPTGATTGKITLTTSDGTAVSATNFTVVKAPTLIGFSPGSGIVGQTITLTGSQFTNATTTAPKVRFNGVLVEAANVNLVNATTLTAKVPPLATSGKISVQTTGGTVLSETDFIVVKAPSITSFSPASGLLGRNVTINGLHLTNASTPKPRVRFNGVEVDAANITVLSGMQIKARVPAGATSGKISVETTGGTAVSANNFTVTTGSSAAAEAVGAVLEPAPGATVPGLFSITGSLPAGHLAAGQTVSVSLKRDCDGVYWDGAAWGTQTPIRLETAIEGDSWSFDGELPDLSASRSLQRLEVGSYTITLWLSDENGAQVLTTSTFFVSGASENAARLRNSKRRF